jgi:hypothetical protein
LSGGTEIVIYTRRDCSLCERMASGAREIAGPAARIALVEIDDDPELVLRFGRDIPVLSLGGEVLCKHFLDADRLAAALAAAT